MDRRYFIKNLALSSIGFALLGTELFAKTISHKVQSGDTLSGLAVKYGTTVRTIKRVNKLRNDRIFIGQHLLIPAPTTYQFIEHVAKTTQDIKVTPNRWRYVITHHSAIDRGNAESYGAYHKRRGMVNGLAYHFVIGNGRDSGDGQVEIGSRWLEQLDGGHVKTDKYNKIGIGICMVGNFQEHPPSEAQLRALYELGDFLGQNVGNIKLKYSVHKEIDGPKHTVCPGRHFPLTQYHRRLG